MWRHIGQSLQGPSHQADDTPCQDTHSVRVFGEDSQRTLVACVADGAGSAKRSDVGSSVACNTIIENAARYFETHGQLENLRFEDAVEWCEDARTRILDAAVSHDCSTREFATTLCVAIIGRQMSSFFQIGDGAIILGSDGLYGVVFWPQSGEYVNSTNFLTSDEYQAQLEFLTTTNPCSSIALMTDGLERLALRFDSQTPHVPFFDPLFRALRSSADLKSLSDGLRAFLGSNSVQNRSDDDKTLILAIRTEDGAA
ncbi:MAG TPA: PP2C family serine/threonine-protein phosphatase [Lacipirellulaceae bacterium]|nr:PP2C family serine/threonine-protein phosphatase [Lacipirellulaceae bacterium]